MTTNLFGEFFKKKRIELGKTLRQFCNENKLDPGNISKLERGLFPPPQGREKLEEYATYLQIKKASDDWHDFFNLARIESGRIPDEILNNSDIVSKLPILFRTLRGQRISDEKLDRLIELIRES